jgi:cytochrome c556
MIKIGKKQNNIIYSFMKMATIGLSFIFASGIYAQSAVLIPPASIKKFYKPENKRQVWLHNMFVLRRARHAIGDYVAEKNEKLLQKWLQKYNDSYKKITQMVPEFSDEIDLEMLKQLNQNAKNKKYSNFLATLRKLDKTCNSCHNDYRAVSVLLYRSADFKNHKIKDNKNLISYKKYMLELTHTINRIKIATTDGQTKKAQKNIQILKQGIVNLSKDCDTCHKKNPQQKNYLNEKLQKDLNILTNFSKNKQNKKLNVTLGTIAVEACAICHGTHRTLYDIKQQITNR